MTIHTTNEQDLNPRPWESMTTLLWVTLCCHTRWWRLNQAGENPTGVFTWKPTSFINRIQSRSHDDSFPLPLRETWFCQSLGVPIPVLIVNPQQWPCRQFNFDPYGDHIQTCHRQSSALPALYIVYKLSLLLHSVGHRVQTLNVTPSADNERGDIEIKDYVILPHGEDDRLPPRTLVMDVTMTHDSYGRTTQHANGSLTNRVTESVLGMLPTGLSGSWP